MAVITGGSRGIGKAIARALAAEGVDLALIARGKEQLDKTVAEICKAAGVRVARCAADTLRQRPESVQEAAAGDQEAIVFPAVHILVDNAGGPVRRDGSADRHGPSHRSLTERSINPEATGKGMPNRHHRQAFLPPAGLADPGSGWITGIDSVPVELRDERLRRYSTSLHVAPAARP